VTLQHAYQQAGIYPDLVSPRTLIFQRITYTYTGGHQIPYLICGASGHWPIENIAEGCDKSIGTKPMTSFPVILPRSRANTG
jgi:hypothetical protein